MADKFDFMPFGTDGYTPVEDEDVVFSTQQQYTDPANEGEIRKQLSTPLFQIKKFLNSLFDTDGKLKKTEIENLEAEDIYIDQTSIQHVQGYTVQDILDELSACCIPVSSTDNGKIMLVTNGEWVVGAIPIKTIKVNGTTVTPTSGTVDITVPTQASDVNAVPTTRTINGNALSSNLSWAQLLPSVSSSDVGKVLQVDNGGNWVLQAPRLYPGPIGEGNDSTE